MVTLTSSSSSTPKTSFDFMKNNNIRTSNPFGPYPSYLSTKEAALTQKKLMEDDLGCKTVITCSPKVSKKEPEEGEIGVFGAEKYFSGDMDSDNTSPRVVSQANSEVLYSETKSERVMAVDPKMIISAKKSAGTPSVRSESSWNSQSVLLQNNKYGKNSSCSSVQGNKNTTSPKARKMSFLKNLGCKCACSDGNSVDVDENSSVKRNSDPCFLVQEPSSRKMMSSPARKIETELSTLSKNRNLELNLQQQEEEMIQRKSLEVFGSPVLEKRSIQKKLTVLPWDSSSTRTEDRGFSVKYSEEDDSGSDASSDLFEIGSLAAKPKPFLARQGSDPASPTCYAPSEVSIEWSVVTASAADFSVMSECATSPIRNRSIQIPRIPNPKSHRETNQRRKSSSGLLLGCNSHKSVRVSGDSYRTMNPTPSYVPRFPTETRRKMSSSSISHSQSPGTASHLLYI